MKKSTMRKYAKLVVRVGANVQKGQPVWLYTSVDQHEFAVMVAEECYRAGASRVQMEWSCQPIAFDDPALGIDWQVKVDNFILSEKDTRNPLLADAEVLDFTTKEYLQ